MAWTFVSTVSRTWYSSRRTCRPICVCSADSCSTTLIFSEKCVVCAFRLCKADLICPKYRWSTFCCCSSAARRASMDSSAGATRECSPLRAAAMSAGEGRRAWDLGSGGLAEEARLRTVALEERGRRLPFFGGLKIRESSLCESAASIIWATGGTSVLRGCPSALAMECEDSARATVVGGPTAALPCLSGDSLCPGGYIP